eukprot:5281798-Amphidinium_carterae.1
MLQARFGRVVVFVRQCKTKRATVLSRRRVLEHMHKCPSIGDEQTYKALLRQKTNMCMASCQPCRPGSTSSQ